MPFAALRSMRHGARTVYRSVSKPRASYRKYCSTWFGSSDPEADADTLGSDGRDPEEIRPLDASQRWKWAKCKILELVWRRRRRKTLRALGLAAFVGGVLVTLGALCIGLGLAWLEGDSLIEQHVEGHGIIEDAGDMRCMRVGSLFCKIALGWYVGYLSLGRIGFGDALVVTTAGRYLTMGLWMIFLPTHVFLLMRYGAMLVETIKSHRSRCPLGCQRKLSDDGYTFAVLSVIAAVHLCLNAAGNYVLLCTADEDITVTATGTIWYSWQLMTTVGYGDSEYLMCVRRAQNYCFEYVMTLFGTVHLELALAYCVRIILRELDKRESSAERGEGLIGRMSVMQI